jgi:hypothetical protein
MTRLCLVALGLGVAFLVAGPLPGAAGVYALAGLALWSLFG